VDEESICYLCDEEVLGEITVTVTRGLDAIRKSSDERGNRIAERLIGLSSIYVHTKCCKKYIRKYSTVSMLESCAGWKFLPVSNTHPHNFNPHPQEFQKSYPPSTQKLLTSNLPVDFKPPSTTRTIQSCRHGCS